MLIAGLLLLLCVADAGTVAGFEAMLVGSHALDAFGRSERQPEPALLRQMLRDRRFAELSSLFEALHDEGAANCERELLGLMAIDALDQPVQRLGALLDDWERADPTSFAPLLVNGSYWVNKAYEERGSAFVSKTGEERFAAMHAVARVAREKLEASVKLRRTPAAYMGLISLAKAEGLGERVVMKLFKESLAICPDSIQMHQSAMDAVQPKWGGSYSKMEAIARSPTKKFPKLKTLQAEPLFARCIDAFHSKAFAAALPWCDKAIGFAARPEMLQMKAQILVELERYEAALVAIGRVIEQRPRNKYAHTLQAWLLRKLKRFDEADAALDKARSIDEPG